MKMPSDEKTPNRRTQAQRRAETKAQLLDTAKDLFLTKGYDQTGMPELVKTAGLTRGALYHHFEDKSDLFRALAEREAKAIGLAIDMATKDVADPDEAMMVGTNAYFDAMAVPGRAKILLVLAPAILGTATAKALTASEGSTQLRGGLSEAMPHLREGELDALTDVLSATFDRAALEIAEGADRDAYIGALSNIVQKLLGT